MIIPYNINRGNALGTREGDDDEEDDDVTA